MLALFFVVGAFVVFLNFVRPAYREISEMRGKELSLTAFRDEQKQAPLVFLLIFLGLGLLAGKLAGRYWWQILLGFLLGVLCGHFWW